METPIEVHPQVSPEPEECDVCNTYQHLQDKPNLIPPGEEFFLVIFKIHKQQLCESHYYTLITRLDDAEAET